MVVAATEPDRVDALLRPHYGASLCVVPARVSRAEFSKHSEYLSEHVRSWEVFHTGGTYEGIHPLMTVAVTRVLPALASWAADLPDGILSLWSWLLPAELASATA